MKASEGLWYDSNFQGAFNQSTHYWKHFSLMSWPDWATLCWTIPKELEENSFAQTFILSLLWEDIDPWLLLVRGKAGLELRMSSSILVSVAIHTSFCAAIPSDSWKTVKVAWTLLFHLWLPLQGGTKPTAYDHFSEAPVTSYLTNHKLLK